MHHGGSTILTSCSPNYLSKALYQKTINRHDSKECSGSVNKEQGGHLFPHRIKNSHHFRATGKVMTSGKIQVSFKIR
jgi:hypothetical protein